MNLLTQILKNHALPVLLILVVCCAYFYPQIEGRAISQPDTNHSYRSTKSSWDFYEKNGKRNLWTNAYFSGMPTIQSVGLEQNNIYRYLDKIFRVYIKAPIGAFFFGALAMYIFLVIIGLNQWLAFIGALTYVFSTQHLILYSVGHNSKLDTLFTFPIILSGAYVMMKKKYFLGLVMLAIGVGLNLHQNHYQMTWYLAIFMFALYAVEAVRSWQVNDRAHIGKMAAFSGLALVLALGPNISRILTMADYTPESTRGKRIVKAQKANNEDANAQGLNWEFATRFSFNLVDFGGMIVPRFAGGGGKELIEQRSPLSDAIARSNYPSKSRKVALYYGNQPFTEGPAYIGVVIFMLFVMSLFSLRHHWKWWALGSVLFAVLYAFGSNLGSIHQFLFDHIPLMKRFRAPSSYLSSVVIFFPLLAMWGLHGLMNTKERERMIKVLYAVGGSLAAFFLVMYLIGPNLIDMSHEADQKYINAGVSAQILLDQKISFFKADLLRALVLVLLSGGAIWLYLKNKLKQGWLIGIIGLLAIGDIMSVDYRYIYPNRYAKKISKLRDFEPNAADKEILKDKDPHFRVFDISQDPFKTSDVSYFHKSIGGYNAAKLRRYNDVIEYYLTQGSSRLPAMLNAKYFIRKDENGNKFAELNSRALGNAWFVENMRFVNSDQEEIDAIASIDPDRMAVIHNEFAGELAGLAPVKNGRIRLSSYSPDEMIYTCESPTENLAIFSEVWYGPNKGWQAYIDNKPVDHIRANYILRALRVPAGSHTIKFVFNPSSFRIGETLSLIFSILTALVLGYLIYREVKRQPALEKAPQKTVRRKTVKKKKKKG